MLVYATFALFSTWKFMFTPMAGPIAGLTFLETFISCFVGGVLSVSVFYFGSSYFMELNRKRKLKRYNRRAAKGKKVTKKVTFNKTNRRIIKFKKKIGFFPICWLFPLFLSLPLGSIITAKFYKHQRLTFLFIITGVFINCLVITSGTYFFYSLQG